MVAEGKDSDPEVNDQSGGEFPDNDQSDNVPGELFPDENNENDTADELIPANNQSSIDFQSPVQLQSANIMPVSATLPNKSTRCGPQTFKFRCIFRWSSYFLQ